jgi:hypothetical protein
MIDPAPHALHHIALCTPCITLVNGGHVLHMRVDHTEPKSEIQAVQVQWSLGGPQVLRCEDANLVLNHGKPRCI